MESRPATHCHTDFISIIIYPDFFALRIWQNTDFLPWNLAKYRFFFQECKWVFSIFSLVIQFFFSYNTGFPCHLYWFCARPEWQVWKRLESKDREDIIDTFPSTATLRLTVGCQIGSQSCSRLGILAWFSEGSSLITSLIAGCELYSKKTYF